jgi:hypothetical protein
MTSARTRGADGARRLGQRQRDLHSRDKGKRAPSIGLSVEKIMAAFF